MTHSSTEDRTVTVSWGANEPLASAECSVDGAAPKPCGKTSQKFTLAEGEHNVRVRGTDSSRNKATAFSPAVNFRIIDTKLVSGPADFSTVKAPQFVFSTLTGVRFDCSIDGAAFADCGQKGGDNRGSFKVPTNLKDGRHTFRVLARDLGEFDHVPVVRSWVVDTVAPKATLDPTSGPGEGALQAVNKETSSSRRARPARSSAVWTARPSRPAVRASCSSA